MLDFSCWLGVFGALEDQIWVLVVSASRPGVLICIDEL